jgi:hypothetical protein
MAVVSVRLMKRAPLQGTRLLFWLVCDQVGLTSDHALYEGIPAPGLINFCHSVDASLRGVFRMRKRDSRVENPRVIPAKTILTCLLFKHVVPIDAKEFCEKDHDAQSLAQ